MEILTELPGSMAGKAGIAGKAGNTCLTCLTCLTFLTFLTSILTMRKGISSLLWLLLVITLSVIVLWKLEKFEERREQQGEYEKPTANVLLVGYEGEHFPGSANSGSYLTIGCNDLLVPYAMPSLSNRVQSVLTALSTFDPPEGLHNPLLEKGVSFKGFEEGDRGKLIVLLEGQPTFGGVCDTPRFKKMIEENVKLYAKKFEIRLNGSESAFRCLDDMSGRCK